MTKSKFWEYFVQIIIVIFGVFLGMLLTEWNTDRKEENQRRAILSQIGNEIKDHNTKLEAVIPYHKSLTNSTDSILRTTALEELKVPFLENGGWSKIPGWKGIKLFRLQTSGFESAKLSNTLSGMDGRQLDAITSYYESVEVYNRYVDQVTERIFNISISTTTVDVLILIQILKGDILGMEGSLQKAAIKLQTEIDTYAD